MNSTALYLHVGYSYVDAYAGFLFIPAPPGIKRILHGIGE